MAWIAIWDHLKRNFFVGVQLKEQSQLEQSIQFLHIVRCLQN